MSVARISSEQYLIGFILLGPGLGGLALAYVEGEGAIVPTVFFIAAVLLSIYVRHHNELNRAELLRAERLPPGCAVESLARICLRLIPTVIVLSLALAATLYIGVGATAPLSGLIVGQGLVEIQAARLFAQWEREHESHLFAPTPAVHYYGKGGVPDIFRREPSVRP